MEQKKTLWIIAASGVFLLVVLGAALLLNSSPANVPTTAAITTIDRTPVVAASETPNISPIQTQSSESVLDSNTLAFQKIESGISDEANSFGTSASAESGAQGNAVQLDSANLTINTNTTNIELKTAAVPSSNLTATSRAGEQALAKASGSNKTNYVASAQSTKNETTMPAKSNSQSAPNSAASAKSAQKKTVSAPVPLATKYWVQAASFTNKKSADSARTELDEKKIPAEVFTYKDKKDTLFYRVRVGPYTTKSEAEYWKGRIGSMDFFKDTQSYVTEVKM
ncbi:MAG: SPOR domain-containing protein [Treponemataceae bacterium]|nr:SPOR domain-containing protein [Treponemataceae bacterium]